MKKKFYIALILTILISTTLTSCGKDSQKKNTTSSKPKVENKDKDNSKKDKDKDNSKKEESSLDKCESNVSTEVENKTDSNEVNSKDQESIGINNNIINSVGDNSGVRPNDYYIDEIISNYEELLVSAIEKGDFSIISSMIVQDSNFYNKQKEYIENSYNNNVKYNLLDYNIDKIKEIDSKTYKVYVVENIEIKESSDDNFQAKQFKHIYTVKFNDSGIGINSMEDWN